LKHVEEQIEGMTVLPDFGYGQDNYILKEEGESKRSNWNVLTDLIDNPDKF
jgi:hypothetical protein